MHARHTAALCNYNALGDFARLDQMNIKDDASLTNAAKKIQIFLTFLSL